MRRLGLFAVLLSLVGLSTAVAASFDVQTEDIASFSTSTSISVPAPPVVLKPYYLSDVETILPGLMAQEPEPSDGVNGKHIDIDATTPLLDQTAVNKHHSWRAPGPLVLSGPASLELHLNGTVLAQLFDCPASAPSNLTGCTPIAPAVESVPHSGNQGTADFGGVSATISSSEELRLKIVNPETNPQVNVQWGYKSNRESRLDITVVSAP